MDDSDIDKTSGNVNAKVLEWARKEAAYPTTEVARILEVPESIVVDWEQGSQQPNFNILRQLSLIYDTPFSYFFLSKLPQIISISDYRGKPQETKRQLSRDTKLVLREFRRLHRFSRILRNLVTTENTAPLNFISGNENMEELASRERRKLGITSNDKKQWRNKQYAWQQWRSAIENLGISVFSLRMSPLECHGAVISEKPYSILVNRGDAPAAKGFTLLHEYYHLLLNSEDSLYLCDSFPSKTESKPNQFASLVLVSNQEFLEGLKEKDVHGYREFWPNSILDDLSKILLVSRDVVAIRLEQLGYAPEGFYAKRRLNWESSYRDTAGFGLGGKTKMGHAREKIGDSTLNLIRNAIRSGAISTSDAASFLGEVRGSRTGAPWKITINDIEKWTQNPT